jgi:hypothetical protein
MEDKADSLDLVRHNLSAGTARRLPKTTAPGIVFQPVNPEDSAAIPIPDQLQIGYPLLIDVVSCSKVVREEKQP